jgi:hypothetical protein
MSISNSTENPAAAMRQAPSALLGGSKLKRWAPHPLLTLDVIDDSMAVTSGTVLWGPGNYQAAATACSSSIPTLSHDRVTRES